MRLRIPTWRGIKRRLGLHVPHPAPPPAPLAEPPSAATQRVAARLTGKHLYFGNLLPHEAQFISGDFVGLALEPRYEHDVRHDASQPLPVRAGSVRKIQSQDVFEHIPFDDLPPILDDIYRALAPRGLFRLSMPDYRSPLLRRRSAFDENGEVIADPMMGGIVTFDRTTNARVVQFVGGGEAHVWFPTYEKVQALVQRSALKDCAAITFHHYFRTTADYVVQPFAEDGMPVMRAPPRDKRAGGAPISIIVDFVK